VKTDVEELSPTRVRLTIEVPFDELKPNVDRAYREVARQVRVPGFRPGRVPPRVIDQRIGRGAVLEQAVNDAVPELYGKALEEHDVFAIGQPEVEITRLDDGKDLAFTAEVDVRPKFDLPDIDGMPVTVENAEVTPDRSRSISARCGRGSPRSRGPTGRPPRATSSRSTCPPRWTASRSRTRRPTASRTRSAAGRCSTGSMRP